MTASVERFYSTIPHTSELSNREKIEFFAYFLEAEAGGASFTTAEIVECFEKCSLVTPSNIAQILSRGTKERPASFLKAKLGYRLERHFRDELAQRLGGGTHTVNVSTELRRLEGGLREGPGKEWFGEALDCFGVGAYRASILMFWIFALDHLYSYIVENKLTEFNTALSTYSDQKAAKKVGQIVERDNFTLMGEEMFIEVCKAARIISPDVRKILLEKLGIRNSIAHPSGIRVLRTKAIEFAEDLMANIIQKYEIPPQRA